MKKTLLTSIIIVSVLMVFNFVSAVVRTTLISQTGTTLITQNLGGYPGSGWQPNTSGSSGIKPLTKATCDAQGTTTWAWFADMNNNGVTTDGEDGACVQTLIQNSLPNASWNGALLVGKALASTTISAVTFNTVTTAATLPNNNTYAGNIIQAGACWGVVQSNTANIVTVYGNWLDYNYGVCTTLPSIGDTFKIFIDGQYDNSWIGDYTCTDNFPSGTVVAHSFPTTTDTGGLAVADCKDGKRDLLPNETDRAVLGGTISTITTDAITGSSTISDSSLVAGAVDANVYIGQKVLITGGTGLNSYGFIESNATSSFTVASTTAVPAWSGTAPVVGSAYKIIYVIPRGYTRGASDSKQNNGPLTTDVLKSWKGTRLPTHMDWFDYCGKDSTLTAGNGGYKANSTDTLAANKTYGSNGGQIGRINQLLNLANSGSVEWFSERNYSDGARVGGGLACSYINSGNIYNSIRVRVLFRP